MRNVIADPRMVRWLTAEVIGQRFRLENERKASMAIELKGIRGKALAAAKHLDRINAAYDAFNEAAPLHAADVEGLAPQIHALNADLQFAAQVLGNSAGGQEQNIDPDGHTRNSNGQVIEK